MNKDFNEQFRKAEKKVLRDDGTERMGEARLDVDAGQIQGSLCLLCHPWWHARIQDLIPRIKALTSPDDPSVSQIAVELNDRIRPLLELIVQSIGLDMVTIGIAAPADDGHEEGYVSLIPRSPLAAHLIQLAGHMGTDIQIAPTEES